MKGDKTMNERTKETIEKPLIDWTQIIIETDEENPKTIAVITADSIRAGDGYRVRLKPKLG